MTAEELDRLVTGQIVLPSGHRARHLRVPQSEATPRLKRGRPRKLGPTKTEASAGWSPGAGHDAVRQIAVAMTSSTKARPRSRS